MSWGRGVAVAFAAAAQAADSDPHIRWYQADPAALDQLFPEGVADEPHDARWSVHPTGQWIMGNHPDATPEQLQRLEQLLQEQHGAFAYSMADIPGYSGPLGPAHFQLKEDKPMYTPPRKYTDVELQIGDKKVAELLEAAMIYEVPTLGVRHAQAPTLPLKRLPDGSWGDHRWCLDSRQLNSNTVVDRYGMPLPEDLFRQMAGARFFSKLDMRSGFFQVELDLPSQLMTVFHWRGKCYAFKRLPFGHVNATAIFQRRMDLELQAAGLQHCTCVFVDDICIYSNSMEEHLQQLQQLLQHLQQVGLRAHPAKTIVATDCLPFLGHLVSGGELKPDPAKVAAMAALQPPDSVKRLQAHLGLLNYYRCYIPCFANMAQPLYALLRKGAQYLWGSEQDEAYRKLKAALTQPGLALQQPDPHQSFILYTDWSSTGIAAVLNQQDQQGQERLVACVSRSLNDAERNYPAWKGELLAAVYGIRAFRPYLLTREFQLVTDHKALLWMLTQQHPTGQLARWILSVSEFQFGLTHRAGVDNPADLPSREPQAQQQDWTGSRLDTEMPQCSTPKVLLPNGQLDPHQYTAEELTAHVAERNPAVAPQPRGKKAATAVTAAAAILPEPNLRPSQLLAEEVHLQPLQQSQLQQQALHALAALSAASCNGIDQFDPIPDWAASLQGSAFPMPQSPSPEPAHVARAWHPLLLQAAAAGWVQKACSLPLPPEAINASAPPLQGQHVGPADSHGVRLTQQLCTKPVASSFFPAALQHGITLYEPFGGLCAGLEMVLKAGIQVNCYIHSDIDASAQIVAQHRVQQLAREFPHLLPHSAYASAFATLPDDVRQVTTSQLAQLVALKPGEQWLVVAGWPCQDLSAAGKAAGLAGQRAQLLHDLVRILGALQQLQPSQPPAYVIENVAFQLHPKPGIAAGDFDTVCSIIGQPATFDAAQFGSLAHRLRNYWSNLAAPKQVAGVLPHVPRATGRTVQLALQPGRESMTAQREEQPPYFPCNQPGATPAAWPTLMASPGSYAFRPQQPGSVWDPANGGNWTEPTAVEREVALGYLPGATAAPSLSEQERRALLGQCIDANALQGLMAICQAWWSAQERQQQCTSSSNPGQWGGAMRAAAAQVAAGSPSAQPSQQQATGSMHAMLQAIHIAAAAQEVLSAGGTSSDIWLDQLSMQTLQQGQPPANTSSKDSYRVRRRLQLYSWDPQQQQLLRRLPDGSTRFVPQPQQRLQLIQQQHELCGHFGVRRTAAMLATKYWWHGMLADTAAVVKRCVHCSRVQASFNGRLGNSSELRSIPISSLGFRWHVDLAGPLPETSRGNTYVMVAVEAFSKWLEAVPIADNTSATVAHAFLHAVLARYAAPGQVVTDNGHEFVTGPFPELLEQCLIDHCTTSPSHPQANGQAEKAVGTVKQALRKMCLQQERLQDWDQYLAWLALGYRCTPHSSTGFSPYELMYARQPVIPPAVKEAMRTPLDYDDPETAAVDLLQRKAVVQRLCPEALQNLSIAQHRDQRRYAVVRSAGYTPRMYRFQAGDYVYLQQNPRHSTLQPQAKPSILRVLKVLPSGVLQLQGKCGRTASVHSNVCSPCHLPHLDPDIDPVLVGTDVDHIVCEVCDREEPESHLLLCDLCNAGYHTFCLQPPLQQIPAGAWLCPQCVQEGNSLADAAAREQQRQQLAEAAAQPQLFPSAATRHRDGAAAALHGRLVLRPYSGAAGQPAELWGKLHFLGPQYRPRYFTVVYQDGQEEDCSVRQVRKWLLPADTQLPLGISFAEPTPPVRQL